METTREICAHRQAAPRRPSVPVRCSCVGVAPLLLLFAFFWPFGGGNKVQMMAGQATPAARGTIAVSTGNNGNTELDLKVRALAPPSSLTPAENVYVVWIQPPGQNAENRGELRVDGHEDGELRVESPHKRFKLFITAEQNAQAQMPQGPQVLSADVEQH